MIEAAECVCVWGEKSRSLISANKSIILSLACVAFLSLVRDMIRVSHTHKCRILTVVSLGIKLYLFPSLSQGIRQTVTLGHRQFISEESRYQCGMQIESNFTFPFTSVILTDLILAHSTSQNPAGNRKIKECILADQSSDLNTRFYVCKAGYYIFSPER